MNGAYFTEKRKETITDKVENILVHNNISLDNLPACVQYLADKAGIDCIVIKSVGLSANIPKDKINIKTLNVLGSVALSGVYSDLIKNYGERILQNV